MSIDLHMKEFLCLTPEAEERVWQSFSQELARLEPRQRQRSAAAEASLRYALICVIANGIKACAAGRPRRVAYPRRTSAFSNSGPYHPPEFNQRPLLSVVDGLANLGMLICSTGQAERFTRRGQGRPKGMRSTYRPTKRFRDRMAALELGLEDVRRDWRRWPALILKSTDGARLSYDPLAEPQMLKIGYVRAFNEYLQSYSVSLPDREAEEAAGLETPITPADCSIENSLYRVFNGSWERNGRWYGGWWQRLPSRLRSAIRLDGEETVELDYQGCLVRLAYHSLGQEFGGDPYEIPAIRERAEAEGPEWPKVRNGGTKVILQALMNTANPGQHLPTKKPVLPASMTADDGYDEVRRFHAPLNGLFQNDRGLELVNQEASICTNILHVARVWDMPILPIHDSFIVKAKDEERARDLMIMAYEQALGFRPVVH